MRFLVAGLLIWATALQANAQNDKFPNEIEARFDQENLPGFSTSQLKLVHPMAGGRPVVWTYWIEGLSSEADTAAIHAIAHATSVDHAASYPDIEGCHLRRALAPSERRFLNALIDNAFYSEGSAEQRGCICPKLDQLAANPVCVGGASSFIRISQESRTIGARSACGANDAFGLLGGFVEAMIHPVYSRPYESCAQNQTPQYIVSEENIEE